MASSYTVSETKVRCVNIFIVESNINIFINIFMSNIDISSSIRPQFRVYSFTILNSILFTCFQSESEVIPYSTDTSMSPSHKMSSLPKLINLEQRPPSQCSSPTNSGMNSVFSPDGWHFIFYIFPGRFSKHKDKFYIEWEKMQVMIDQICCVGRSF